MSNKPFNLEKALAGEPVKLRNGWKAYVKYVLPDGYKGDYPLVGFIIDEDSYIQFSWMKNGKSRSEFDFRSRDIVSMWEEPRPRVQLDLPCPLKEPQEELWYIRDFTPIKLNYCERHKNVSQLTLENGLYFATKEDAQAWLDAMRNARR